jgi:molybdopterin-guanine dinucleotide biosynthesis protein A
MTGVVLAGGKSRRMGKKKPEIVLGNITLLERVVEKLKALFPRVIIATSHDESISLSGVESIPDPLPGYGSLMGIYAGLNYAEDSVFAVACDMPFINTGLIRYMIEHAPGWDVVVPNPGGLYEPLHAIYTPACIPFMEEMIQGQEHRIIKFYDKVKVLELGDKILDTLDPQRLSFFNINSPQDLARAQELLAKQA